MVGKYERGDASPSIEVAKKIADALEVSLDYLVGEGVNSKFDKSTLKRIEEIQQLEEDKKKRSLMSSILSYANQKEEKLLLIKKPDNLPGFIIL